jgi:hypothetical protein
MYEGHVRSDQAPWDLITENEQVTTVFGFLRVGSLTEFFLLEEMGKFVPSCKGDGSD